MTPIDPIVNDPEQPIELPPAVSTTGYKPEPKLPAWAQTALAVVGFLAVAAVIWFVASR